MAKKVKTASPYFLILVLVGMLIGFNYFSSKVKADTGVVGTTVEVGNVAPTVSAVSFGAYPSSGADGSITLVEDTEIDIRVSATVTDNTCVEISGAKAYVFISSASWEYDLGGTTCSWDYNNCYVPQEAGGNMQCTQSSCTGGVALYDCIASADAGDGLWYHATPTDAQASFSAAWWYAMVITSDSSGADAFATSSAGGMDVGLLSAIAIGNSSDSIGYGSITPGSESAAALQRGVENTGNRGTKITIAATEALQTAGGESIASEQQEYASDSFSIAEGDGASLSETATVFEAINLPKPIIHTAGANDDQIFWGIAVPAATTAGSYTGQTTYTTISD